MRQKVLLKNLKKWWRFDKEKNIEVYKNGGWHFNNCFSPEEISIKLKSFAHSEFSEDKFSNINVIKEKIQKKSDLFGRGWNFVQVKIDNTFQHTEVGGTDIGTIYIGKPDSSTATLMYGATEIRAGNAKLRINDVDGFQLFDNDLKFIPTEIFQITNKEETGKPLFKVNFVCIL